MVSEDSFELENIGARTAAHEGRIVRRTADLYANDSQFRDAEPLAAVGAAVRRPGMRLAQIVATAMEGYADRPALGRRAHELTTDVVTGRTSLRLLPRFETISYRELWARVRAVAGAWHHDREHPLRAGDFVCVMGFTSSDYTTIDLACIHLGAVAVPLQTGAPVSQLKAIITETQPRILATSIDSLDSAVESVLAGAAPERVIVFDYQPEVDDQRDIFESARRRLAGADSAVAIDTLTALLEHGTALPPAPLFVDADDTRLAALIYTSGSTGTPKGAMFTEQKLAKYWLYPSEMPMIHLNYMPMSHVYGRAWVLVALASGGTGYFTAKSDLSTLFEDFALVRPTSLNFVPRICEMVFQRYQSELGQRTTEGATRGSIEAEVKADVRYKLFGGRFLTAMCVTAPLAAEMRAFMESCLDLPLQDSYGSTEAGGIIRNTVVQRPPVIDYKLIDVPELGYFGTDSPCPRGELLVKSSSIMPGYYKRPEVTAAMFDDDGYYKTGDIMAEIGPDRLVYVDRRNNVLKLSQGEFVTVSRLESVFVNSPLIRQIFVYGSSERAYLLAVIVPTVDALERYSGDIDALTPSLGESLRRIAKDADLNSYEIPRDFLIEIEPFSLENGLLSGVGKPLRPALKAHYGERLEQLYIDLADGEANELNTLRRIGRDQPVLETVSRAARALLRSSTTDLNPSLHFADLGGDSLSALSFSTLLQQIYDVEVSVGVITSPANDLQQLANYIEAELASGVDRPTFATVHGRDSSQISAGDLTLDKFIDAATLAGAKALPQPGGAPRTVLLTGANGYLGRFLCLEWLKQLTEVDGKLVCIVRGSSAVSARKRLDEVFDSGDAELAQLFRNLAAENLEVLAGDIGEPNLGLDEQTWSRLADSVDLIVHPAALVNHVLPYSQLFGPNVVGTAEVIRLAITARVKPVNYLSTVAVGSQIDPSAFDEDADIRITSSVRTTDETYVNGYGNSKWAGEVLLREAHELCGLSVAVFRSDMILAHSRYAGQVNVPDVFTRLLLSLMATGIAPGSFYQTGVAGHRQRAHYDGLPADFTAEAITALGGQATAGFRTFNVVNPHDDGISLDEFVDWLIEAGYLIARIDDYDGWFARFETAIRALPEKQRQHSLLPLIQAYRRPRAAIRGSGIPAQRFRAAVQAGKIGPDNDIPHLSAALIGKYIADLRQLDLL